MQNYTASVKDIAINREALLNRLCALYAGKKEYGEVLKIAQDIVDVNFAFCYPTAETLVQTGANHVESAPVYIPKRGKSPYDKDIREPFNP